MYVYLNVCVCASNRPILIYNTEAKTIRIHLIMRETIFSVASCGHSSMGGRQKLQRVQEQRSACHLNRNIGPERKEAHPRDICVGQNVLKINA